MYINGEWIRTHADHEITNPATGEVVDKVFLVDEKQTQNAINAAESALVDWSKKTAEERAAYLEKVATKLSDRKEVFAQLITKEMGKSIHNSYYEVESSINYFKWYAEEIRRAYGDVIPASDSAKRLTAIKQPIGVVGAITPWNFPLQMVARKLAPALAAGCTVILKPALNAPLSSIALFSVFDEVEIPKGVVNLVLGKASKIAGVLMDSEVVKKITFTGSTEVGKTLIRQSADTVKKVSMELGGHAPFIVFSDADLDLAIKGLIKSKFASSGQQCVSPNRIYVQEDIYVDFSDRLKEEVLSLKVGDGLDVENDVGALIDEEGIAKTHHHVVDATNKGATLLTGGRRLEDRQYKNGYFYAPTVLTNVTEEMEVTVEETFGPVIPLIKFASESEVIEEANNTKYGLASYFYTNDLNRMYRVSEELEYGIVGVNDAAPFTAQAPFGGFKQSGLGKEGGYQGLEEYLETKFISVGHVVSQ